MSKIKVPLIAKKIDSKLANKTARFAIRFFSSNVIELVRGINAKRAPIGLTMMSSDINEKMK